jgi:magnesium transporter
MQPEFVAVPPFWNVGQVIDFMRETHGLPDTFSEIFVVDPAFKALGSVNLSHLLRSKRDVLIEGIMEPDREVVQATDDQQDVARKFRRHDLMAAPVVDSHQRLVGVATVDDIEEGADESRLWEGSGTSPCRIPWPECCRVGSLGFSSTSSRRCWLPG